MQHRDFFILEAMLDYCNKISNFLNEYKIDEQTFYDNPYHQDTCAFYCLQIGELANDLSESFTIAHNEIEWRKIIALRNVIAHEYGAIDITILWSILNKNIPELRSFCIKHLK